MKRTFFAASALALLGLLTTGCSEAPPPTKKAEEKKAVPADPVTALSALTQIYLVARQWTGDAKLIRLENYNVPEVAPQPGKCGVWKATFVSVNKRIRREFTFSVVEAPGLQKGASAGVEGAYAPSNMIRPFFIQDVKIDTPAALATAIKEVDKDKDLKKILADNKDLQPQYVLEWTGVMLNPTWRIFWGTSPANAKFSIFVDANTGNYIKKMR
jgi:hypothetical protein